jgi:hypothetical protein
MRANEISFFIVPLAPAYKAGLAGHLPVKFPNNRSKKAVTTYDDLVKSHKSDGTGKSSRCKARES